MNEFESRWKLGAAAARSVEPGRDEAAPFGFATRIAAQRPKGVSPATVWQRFAVRLCAALAIVVAALASLHALTANDGDALRPDIEKAVDDIFWVL